MNESNKEFLKPAIEGTSTNETEIAHLWSYLLMRAAKNFRFEELMAPNQEEGNKKFKQFVRSPDRFEFTFHQTRIGGQYRDQLDFDSKTVVWLFEKAGIKAKNREFVRPGKGAQKDKINIEIGSLLGVSVPLEESDQGWGTDRTIIIDHHPKDTKDSDELSPEQKEILLNTSATKLVFEGLKSTDLFERLSAEELETLGKMVNFVTQMDNKNYPGQHSPRNFENSWRTVLGLYPYIPPDKLFDFFKSGRSPEDILEKQDAFDLGLIYTQKKEGQPVEINRPADRREMIEKSTAMIKELIRDGFEVQTKCGRFLVEHIADQERDTQRRKGLPLRVDAALAYGYDGIIFYNETTESYFINVDPVSSSKLDLKTPDGVNVRGKMYIRNASIRDPLGVSLREIIQQLGGEPNKARDGLKHALEENDRWIKTEVVQVGGDQIEWFDEQENIPAHWGLSSRAGRKHGAITDGLPKDFNPTNEKDTKIELRIYKYDRFRDVLLLKVVNLSRPEKYQERTQERVESKIYVVEISFVSGSPEAILPNGQRIKMPEKDDGYDTRYFYKISVGSDGKGKLKVLTADQTNDKVKILPLEEYALPEE